MGFDTGGQIIPALGIKEISQSEYGDVVRFENGEVPVLWACP